MPDAVVTARLRLEPWDRRAHGPGLAEVNADPEVMEFLNGGVPFTRVQSRMQSDRIADHWRTYGFGLWAVIERATGAMAGFAGLSHPLWLPDGERVVEVGWRLLRRAWGRGYATEAGAAALRYGFGELALPELISLIHPDNARSAAVATRLGLEPRRRIAHPTEAHQLVVYALAAGASPAPAAHSPQAG